MDLTRALFATLGTAALLVGCDNPTSAPRNASDPKDRGGVQATPATNDSVAEQEGAAKEKLKTAIDAWVMGDPYKDFEKSHPEIRLTGAIDWRLGKVLMRYELVSVAEGGFGASDIGVVSSTLGPPGA